MTNKLTLSLVLVACSSLLACGGEEAPLVEPIDAVIGEAQSLDSPAPTLAQALTERVVPEASLLAYCDDVTTWNSSWAKFESDVLALVNQRRAAGATCGGVAKPKVAALTLDTKLRCAARKHSKDMGTKNFFSHTGSNGSSFSQRITSAGYTWTGAGENIAAGQTTPAAVMNSWMTSTGHCNNIMNGTFKHLGVGYYYSSTSTYKHYWTQDFAKP
jgi:uncharacterized protein YkwD